MPKGTNQKMKLLLLAEILKQESDQEHPLTVQQIISFLSQKGIQAERKSIYDDIAVLQQFGMDIIIERKSQNLYYLGEREFQLAELQLLVDAALSAKFITAQKSQQLIGKIGGLVSRNQAQILKRELHVNGRTKTPNEKIYYTVDTLQLAMAHNSQVQFHYYQWVVDKTAPGYIRREQRHGGKAYEVSPWALVWDDENYYLIAYEAVAQQLRHHRVDKMEGIQQVEKRREGELLFSQIDMAKYTQGMFGMFGGKGIEVEIQFANSLIGVVIDRFGGDITIFNVTEKYFSVKIEAVPSPQFIGWIIGFGTEVQVIEPKFLRKEIAEHLQEIEKLYKK